jgi:hypothetical protein
MFSAVRSEPWRVAAAPRERKSGSHKLTLRWRETDSNPRSPVKKNPLVETVLFHLQHFPFREGPRVRIHLPPPAVANRTSSYSW